MSGQDSDRWYRMAVAWTGAALIAGVLLAIGRQVVPDVLDLVRESGHDARVVAAALLVGTLAIWWAGLRHAGPVAASPAQQRWKLWAAPGAWIRRARWRIAPWVLAAAAMLGAVVGLASGDQWQPAVTAGGLAVVVLVAAAAVVMIGQRRDGGALVVLVIGAGAFGLLTGSAWGPWWGVAVAVATGLPALGAMRRGRPFRTIPRWNLTAAARRRSAVGAAVVLLEPEAVRTATGAAAARQVPVRLLRRSAVQRLAIVASWRALPGGVLRIAAGLVVAAALTEVLTPYVGLAAVAITLHTVTVATTRDLLAWWDLPSLKRVLATPDRATSIALAVPCAVATAALLVATAVVLSPSVGQLVALIVVPVLGTWSRAAAAETAEQLTMVSTPMGAIPVQLVLRVVAGADATVISLVLLGVLA